MTYRWKYMLGGAGLSIMAPVFWAAIIRWAGNSLLAPQLYLFLTAVSLFSVLVMSYLLGSKQDKLTEVKDRDQLTGLFNQNAFFRVTEILLALSLRERFPLSILMLDLDHFKEVNDQGGHVLGSYVLKEVAKIIKSELRSSDVTAKFGGDEFIICLPRCDVEKANIPAERIRKRIKNTAFHFMDQSVRITCSIGIAQNNESDGLNTLKIIEAADAALYEAKNSGRDRIRLAGSSTPQLKQNIDLPAEKQKMSV